MLYSETEWTSDVDQTLKKLLEQSRSTLESCLYFAFCESEEETLLSGARFKSRVEVVDFQYI